MQSLGIKKGVPVAVNRLHGSSILFALPDSLLEVRFVDSSSRFMTWVQSSSQEANVQTYFLALTMPERYRLPFLLLRKVTPPMLALLGVGLEESYVPNIRERALILRNKQMQSYHELEPAYCRHP